MNELFLGIIALAVLVMAIIQVAAIMFAARTARQVAQTMTRLEQGVQPIVANLQKVSADAARASASAAAQVERAGRLLDDVTTRVDSTIADAFSLLEGLRSIFDAFRRTGETPRKRHTPTDDEDALFIG